MTKLKTVSGTCEECGKPFKNTYNPPALGIKSPKFYCPDCQVIKTPIWHTQVYGGMRTSQLGANRQIGV